MRLKIATSLVLLILQTNTVSLSKGQARAPVILDHSDHRGRLTVMALDGFGSELPSANTSIEDCKNLTSGENCSARFHKGVANTLPYGRYSVTLRHSLSSDIVVKLVTINRPETVLPVAFDVLPLIEKVDQEYGEIAGKVIDNKLASGERTEPEIRTAYLSSIFADNKYVSTVITSGYFTFDDVVPGSYLLTIVERRRVLSVYTLSVKPNEHKEIVADLSTGASPTDIH